MTLKEAASPYWTNLVTGLAGGAVGGGLAHLGTSQEEGESADEFSSRRMTNTLTGAGAGAVTGAAAPEIGRMVSNLLTPGEPGALSKTIDAITPWKHPLTAAPIEGAIGGAAAGGALGRVAQGQMPGKPSPLAERLTSMDTDLGVHRDNWKGVTDAADSSVALAEKAHKATGNVVGGPEHLALEDAIHQRDMLNQTLPVNHPNSVAQLQLQEATRNRAEFARLMQANNTMPWYKKFIGSQTERDLNRAGAPTNWRHPRVGARIGTVAGAAGFPLLNYMLGND